MHKNGNGELTIQKKTPMKMMHAIEKYHPQIKDVWSKGEDGQGNGW